MEYENLNLKEAFDKLESSNGGLTGEETEKRLEKYGPNELEEKKKVTHAKILLRQFANFIVYVLLAAAVISFIIGESLNFWVISSIIGFVIVLGFIQEYKAEKAMEALKKIVQPTTKVLRGGIIREIPTREVVPGDILLLETGDRIPADGKTFEVIGLKVDEAALTGESIAVEKTEYDLLFAGTQVVHGRSKALVIATGMQTKLGKIAGMIQEVEEKTPLQIKISQLAKSLAIIALIACTLTFVLGLLTGAPLAGILMVALALAVAAVPEGLPLTLTLTLAHGMHRMAGHNAIVRKMVGVETLGSTTVICTDKTGTITKNEMTVEKIFVGDVVFDVTGSGYEPQGEFLVNDKKADVTKEKNLIFLLKAAALCNNSTLVEKEGKWQVIGDPTEASLIVAAAKANLWKHDLEKYSPRIEEIIFTSERKLMTTLHKRDKEKIASTKGAPEIVLKICRFIEKNGKIEELNQDEIIKILEMNRDFTSSAFRVLGIAYKKVSGPLTPEDIEKDMIFLGLVAMIDPPRGEVKGAVATCKRAGIKVVMITGDNKETAKAIGEKVGLFDRQENEEPRRRGRDVIITGRDLDALDDKELESIIEDIVIYARTMPEHAGTKIEDCQGIEGKRPCRCYDGGRCKRCPCAEKSRYRHSNGYQRNRCGKRIECYGITRR
jgi:Ca2+-transporting ATPase